jgi:hypothetical protein
MATLRISERGGEYDFSWVQMVSGGLDEVCFGVIVEYNTTQQEQELAMHRKLIHSVHALGVALSLLIAGLTLAVPASAPGGLVAGNEAALTTAEVQAKASSSRAHSRHRRSQARDAMALPFFSFAQGLRRSNRN